MPVVTLSILSIIPSVTIYRIYTNLLRASTIALSLRLVVFIIVLLTRVTINPLKTNAIGIAIGAIGVVTLVLLIGDVAILLLALLRLRFIAGRSIEPIKS